MQSDVTHRALGWKLTRRRFVMTALAGAGALSAFHLEPTLLRRAQDVYAAGASRFGLFDDHTFDTIQAVGGQIVPSDGTPGANEVSTASFIELNATGNAELATLLTHGVAAIDESSILAFGAALMDLSFSEQTQLLQKLENGSAPGTGWNSVFFANYRSSNQQSIPEGLRRLAEATDIQAGPLARLTPNFLGMNAQQVVFGTLRTLHKLAWLINWPEAFVRNPSNGQPIFADSTHLISDPNVPSTQTCWDVINYTVFDWETEQLHWAWQAGLKVTGFEQGWPTFAKKALTDKQRLDARDELHARSNAGIS